MKRRDFLKFGTMIWAGWSAGRAGLTETADKPTVLSTWDFGPHCHRTAQRVIADGGSALEAAQRGVMQVEADPDVTSVGVGGYPNATGVVELDAAVMDGDAREAGSVAGIRDIKHPVAVARLVMDETPHVMLVGDGARRFALEHGFKKENLLTPGARQAWKDWKQNQKTVGGPDHDTVGMIVRDGGSSMAAACTTSGMAFKLPGRVGDSPLIGHGLYCDSEAGGATATGVGEEVIKVCGSYQVVEFMRQGLEPDEAIERVLERAVRRAAGNRNELLAFVAMRADGLVGFGSTVPGFQATVSYGDRLEVVDVAPFRG